MYTGNLVSVGEKKNLGRFWSPLVLAYPIWCQLNKVLVKYSVFQKWHCTNKDQHYLARKQNPILKFYKIGIAELDQKNLLPLFCSLRNEKPRWYSKKFCIFSKFAKKKKSSQKRAWLIPCDADQCTKCINIEHFNLHDTLWELSTKTHLPLL